MLYLHDPASLTLLKSWPWFQKKKIIYKNLFTKIYLQKTMTCVWVMVCQFGF